MTAYYNENDPKAAAWLRELTREGHIANGVVDERSIADVQPDDLAGFTQVHLFAGIGGWSYALRLAGWPDDRPVWTGSCPCQPFSVAGKRKAQADKRHLWPEMFRLIRECRPEHVFGEQVASAAALAWFDAVSDDLEGEGYAVGAVDLPACCVGAYHIRQRLWWVANGQSVGRPGWAHDKNEGGRKRAPGYLRAVDSRGLAHGQGVRLEGREGIGSDPREKFQAVERDCHTSPWSDSVFTPCRDGKARPVKPGIPVLAHGLPARVVRLRGYGNAIVPQVAAEVIKTYMEAL